LISPQFIASVIEIKGRKVSGLPTALDHEPLNDLFSMAYEYYH
jgi:hypothetical protein